MSNNNLIHYLNSGVIANGTDWGDIIEIVSLYKDKVIVKNINKNNEFSYHLNKIIPYLYPLSCLTETINHEGKDEIPLAELAKIEGTYKGEKYKIISDRIEWLDSNVETNQFWYEDGSFYLFNANWFNSIDNQLYLFQYCFSRRINLFDIPSIDPRTLGDKNPYLI